MIISKLILDTYYLVDPPQASTDRDNKAIVTIPVALLDLHNGGDLALILRKYSLKAFSEQGSPLSSWFNQAIAAIYSARAGSTYVKNINGIANDTSTTEEGAFIVSPAVRLAANKTMLERSDKALDALERKTVTADPTREREMILLNHLISHMQDKGLSVNMFMQIAISADGNLAANSNLVEPSVIEAVLDSEPSSDIRSLVSDDDLDF